MKIKEMASCEPFAQIKALDSDGYSAAFGPVDAAMLDSRFNDQFGDRTVSPVAVDDSGSFKNYAVASIWAIYKDKWTRYRDLFGLTYDVLKPYSLTINYTKTYKTNDETTRTGNQSEKVSGFDSDSLVDNGATTSDSSTTDKRDQTTTTTRDTTGHQSGRMMSDLIQGDLNLHAQMFFGIVLQDMKSELTLSIYD